MRTSWLVVLGLLLAGALVCVGVAVIVLALVLPVTGFTTTRSATSQTIDSGAAPGPGGGPRLGQPAPDFSLPGIDKHTVKLSQFQSKPVVVNFWATWCAPCSAEMTNIEKAYQQHLSDVVVLAVNQDESAEQISGYADLYHLHFPMLLDEHGAVGNMYRVQALPTTVFVERSGNVREVHVGGPMSFEFIEGRIQSLLR